MMFRVRAVVLSALSTSVFGRSPNISSLQRRLPCLLHPSAGRAALSTVASYPAPAAAAAAAPGSSSRKPAVLPPHAPVTTTTASSCTPETVRGRHMFKIAGYSLLKGLGAGKFVRSATFAVGGYDWCVRYCPDGDGRSDCVGLFVGLMTKDVEVRALFDIRLVNLVTGGLSPSVSTGTPTPRLFNDLGSSWGYPMFHKRESLESSEYLRDDCLVMQCDVTVILGTPVPQSEAVPDIVQALLSDTKASPSYNKATTSGIKETFSDIQAPTSDIEVPPCDIQVPPSNHLDNLQYLFEEVKAADVRITVKKDVFHAHRSVLAARSPMFIELELGREGDWVIIDHMEPDVFKALLHFIYTDTLPTEDDLECSSKRKTVEGILAAADTLSLDRLKLMCESILCKNLSVDNVAAILDLANWHHCKQLKDACIRYITSSDRMDDVMASQGYKHLKVACPALVAEISEKASKYCKIK